MLIIVLNIRNDLTMTTLDAFGLSNFKIYHFPKTQGAFDTVITKCTALNWLDQNVNFIKTQNL